MRGKRVRQGRSRSGNRVSGVGWKVGLSLTHLTLLPLTLRPSDPLPNLQAAETGQREPVSLEGKCEDCIDWKLGGIRVGRLDRSRSRVNPHVTRMSFAEDAAMTLKDKIGRQNPPAVNNVTQLETVAGTQSR
jgi:hypothetical protein